MMKYEEEKKHDLFRINNEIPNNQILRHSWTHIHPQEFF